MRVAGPGPGQSQGCATLWHSDEISEVFEACEGSAIAVLVGCVSAIGLEDVEAEAADAGKHTWVGADAGAVFGESHISGVVGRGLDPPVAADGVGGAGSVERRVGDIEGGLAGMAQQPGLAVAGKHLALDADDGGDVSVPVGSGKPVGGIEHRDGAAFVAVATGIVAMGTPERGCGGGDCLDVSVQGRLVVLDLDDQGDVGFCGDLEMFF